MIEVTRKDLCCGCSACEPACPKGIISLVSDKAKFYTSHIQASECIDCEACIFACPTYIDIAPTPKHHAIERFDKENYRIKSAYALIAKDEDLRAKSTSGGAFSLLAAAFFENLDSLDSEKCLDSENVANFENLNSENVTKCKSQAVQWLKSENLDSQNLWVSEFQAKQANFLNSENVANFQNLNSQISEFKPSSLQPRVLGFVSLPYAQQELNTKILGYTPFKKGVSHQNSSKLSRLKSASTNPQRFRFSEFKSSPLQLNSENVTKCKSGGGQWLKSENLDSQNSLNSETPLNSENSQNPRAVVYGAQFDKNMKVLHSSATNMSEIAKFRGSKYVQSDMGDTFERIRRQLRSGVRVLFSGAPCQCAGLRMYLGKEYENLFVIDFICHAIPGPGLWEQYVKYKQNLYGSKMKYAHFRNKSAGWYSYTMKLDFENGSSVCIPGREDEYLNIFFKHAALMESCYNCPAKGYTRYSDITIADFWGIEGVRADFFDDLGTSLVCVNSEKGARWLERIKGACRLAEVEVEQALARNPSMLKSVPRPKKRDEFEKDFARLEKGEVSFEWIYKKYGRDALKVRIKRFVRFGLGALARRVLGKAGAKRLKGVLKWILKLARDVVKGA